MSFDFKNTPKQRVQANTQMKGRTNIPAQPHDMSTNTQIEGSPADQGMENVVKSSSPNVHRRKKLVNG